jgi:hypothetical protein
VDEMNATKIYLGIVVFMGWGFVQLLLTIRDNMAGLVH